MGPGRLAWDVLTTERHEFGDCPLTPAARANDRDVPPGSLARTREARHGH